MCFPICKGRKTQVREERIPLPEEKHGDMEQSNVFRKCRYPECAWSVDACLVGEGGEDGDMMLNDR